MLDCANKLASRIKVDILGLEQREYDHAIFDFVDYKVIDVYRYLKRKELSHHVIAVGDVVIAEWDGPDYERITSAYYSKKTRKTYKNLDDYFFAEVYKRD